MSQPDEFAEMIRAKVLAAYGLKDYDAGLAPVPWHLRVWRRLTFTYRRGKAIDWRSYNRAEEEARAATEAFKASLPGRMHEYAEQFNEMLPEGLRFGFEWGPEE